MSSPGWSTIVMPSRISLNCTPVAATGVGVVELLVMVTVVVTTFARIDHAIGAADVVVGRQHGGLRRREGLVGHVVTS